MKRYAMDCCNICSREIDTCDSCVDGVLFLPQKVRAPNKRARARRCSVCWYYNEQDGFCEHPNKMCTKGWWQCCNWFVHYMDKYPHVLNSRKEY